MSERRYNVVCRSCNAVWSPGVRTPLWWKAKKHAEAGFLDAAHVSGEECGCVTKPNHQNAPYRVFGYDDMCEDFDIPFDTFISAVRKFRALNESGGYVVFVSGVSSRVEEALTSF